MREIKDLVNSISKKTEANYSERIVKIFENLSEYNEEIIKEWLQKIDKKL